MRLNVESGELRQRYGSEARAPWISGRPSPGVTYKKRVVDKFGREEDDEYYVEIASRDAQLHTLALVLVQKRFM